MARYAELANGVKLEFPDETTDEVMQKAVKGYLANQGRLEGYNKDFVESGKSVMSPGGRTDTGTDWYRAAAQALGGMAGGAMAMPAAAASGNPALAYMGMGLGDSMAGQAYDVLSGKPKTIPDALVGATVDALMGSAAPRAFDVGIDLLKRSVVSPVRNALASQSAQKMYADFEKLGVRPSLGSVTGKPAIQSLEGTWLPTMPASVGTIVKHSKGAIDDVSGAASDIASQFGKTLTPQGAGEEIKGAAAGAVARFKSRADDLFGSVAKYFGAERVPAGNSMAFLKSQIDAYGPDSALGARFSKGLQDVYGRMMKDAPDGKLDFKTLQRLRTDIGYQLGDGMNAVDDISRGQLKQLYGALSSDLEAAAKAKGGDAHKAFSLANRYYSLNMEQNIPLLDKVLKTGTDEAAYKLAMTAAQDGGTRLSILRRNMRPEEWDTVAGTVLGRMGRARPGAQDATQGVFSPSTFLTEWSKLAPEAKDALFGGTRYSAVKPELDRLVNVISSLKDVERLANTSRSGHVVGIISTVAGPFVNPIGAVGGTILAPYTAAKLITNKSFVKWLVDGSQAAIRNPNGVSSHLASLPLIALANPEIKDEVADYAAALGLPYRFEQDINPKKENN